MRLLEELKKHTYTPNSFYDHLMGLEDACSGNVDIAIFPAMTGENNDGPALEPTVTEANADYVAEVVVKVVNSDGKPSTFYNGTLAAKVAITTTDGTIAVDDGEQGEANVDATKNITFENGVASFIITLGGTWAEGDTVKITVDDSDVGILGVTVEKNDHFLIDVDADSAE